MFNCDLDAAIFDMDGTLLDTMPYWRYTTLEFMLAHQLPVSDALLTRMYKTSSRRLVMEVAAQNGLQLDQQAVIGEMERYMNRHYLYDANLKCPSVPAFLERLKRAGVRMCVATGSPRVYARNGLRRLGLLDFFDFVTDNYESALTKDSPGYFENLLQRLGTTRERCWVFEDALYAMESAKAAGLRVCAIEDDSQLASRADIKALADVYIRDYAELMR